MNDLAHFASPESVAAALRDGGLREGIDTKADLFTRAAHHLLADGASGSARAYFVPGRIEVLGKHTDYCGGRSLVAAVERGICLVAAPRDDRQVHIHALDAHDSVRFGWDPDLAVPAGRWKNYPMTVARRLARNFPDTCRHGADIAGVRTHSIRLPSFTASVEVVFGIPGARLALRHDAGESAQPYVDGTLLAARRVGPVKGLLRGPDSLWFW